jgi:steroid 5-alpha reductase family enzyme
VTGTTRLVNTLLFFAVLAPWAYALVDHLPALHPIVAVNLLFFFGVCVLFWLVSLIQKSAWLIDAHWTTLPLLIAHFYVFHPSAVGDATRSWLMLGLLWVWSLRLTHSYFRREGWAFGAREDWRFSDKRRTGKHFWWTSLFYAFFSQQVLLVGLTLPFWAASAHAQPFGWPDVAIAVVASMGIAIAYHADTTLYRFVRGKRDGEVLAHGLWRYARHPNYFGEQLFWWSMALYGVRVGEPWVLAGTLVNSIVMYISSRMVEARMLSAAGRAGAYREYCRRTSRFIPWPPRS